MPSVRLVNVSKRFEIVIALSDVTFDVRDGEYLCVLGPTGSGKTTLLRIIAGILDPDEGKITFDDHPADRIAVEERNVAYMPQSYALFPFLNVVENVMYGPLAKGIPRSEAHEIALKLLSMMRLENRVDALPKELSGGMQQRVALARGLASGANLLLLDEPLGALDARLRTELREQLKNIVEESGATVIHVTHDQEEAMSLGDRVLVLRSGRIQQHGTPYHVYSGPVNIFVSNFIGSSNFFEGVVAKRDREGSTIRLRAGLTMTVSETSRDPEEHVVVTVREEKTWVQPWSQLAGTFLPGVVSSIQFLGSFVRFEVTLENGDMIAAKMHLSQMGMRLEPGNRVCVVYDPENVKVYDYPSLGLRRELEVY